MHVVLTGGRGAEEAEGEEEEKEEEEGGRQRGVRVKVGDSALPGSVCLPEQRSPTARSAAKETKEGVGGGKTETKRK